MVIKVENTIAFSVYKYVSLFCFLPVYLYLSLLIYMIANSIHILFTRLIIIFQFQLFLVLWFPIRIVLCKTADKLTILKWTNYCFFTFYFIGSPFLSCWSFLEQSWFVPPCPSCLVPTILHISMQIIFLNMFCLVSFFCYFSLFHINFFLFSNMNLSVHLPFFILFLEIRGNIFKLLTEINELFS